MDSKSAIGGESRRKRRRKPHVDKGSSTILADELKASSFKTPNLSHLVEEKFHQSKDYSNEVESMLSDISYDCTISYHTQMDNKVYPDGIQPNMLQSIPPYAFTQLPSIYDQPVKQRRNRPSKKQRRKPKDGNNQKSVQKNNSMNHNNNDNNHNSNNNHNSVDRKTRITHKTRIIRRRKQD